MERRNFMKMTAVGAAALPEILRAALSESTPCLETFGVAEPRLTPEDFAKVFDVTDEKLPERGWVVSHSWTLGEVRQFGRDIVDTETCAQLPRTGMKLWGYEILSLRDVEPGVLWIVGKRKDGSWARFKMASEWTWSKCGTFRYSKNGRGNLHICQSVRSWLKAMVDYVAENPGCRLEHEFQRDYLAIKDVATKTEFSLWAKCAEDRRLWGISPPPSFVDLLKKPGRVGKLAFLLSVGDHCLEFGDEE
jgi:hypothetical protein